MNRVIMSIFAAAAVLGGLDCIAGNKKGYGERFEEAFRLLGPTALSMAGMICISPSLSLLLEKLLAVLLRFLGTDPALAGGLFAIDMGGYQLAMQLADVPEWGGYFGIIVGAVFGCTLTFTLPVGIGVIEEGDSGYFLKGIILGLITMPVGFLAGGLLFGFSPLLLVRRLAVLLVCALLLVLGLWKRPGRVLSCFRLFVRALKVLITLGLTAGAVLYLLDLESPFFTPVMDAMQTVSSICVVMLGSLPAALFLQRLLRVPLQKAGRLLRLDETAVTAILIGTVSVLPALTMLKDTNPRGRVAVSAYLVSAASLMGAHIAFTMGVSPDLTGPLIAAKLTGAFAALAAALWTDRARQD
ncbi:MAG TPA: ethanolamine utilization protein EutH [Candidatus Eisenbergiella intestinipullorum]|nr:ethanolamine utilization protein EutH [Candidatus Eisenbergiella intestinipullorum]